MTDDTKKCYLCAEQITTEAKTCPYCGARYVVVTKGYCAHDHEVVESNEKGMCSKCGGELVDKQIESRYIGEAEIPEIAPIQPAYTPPPPPSTLMPEMTPPAKKRSPFLLLLILIPLGAIAVGIYLIASGIDFSKPPDLPISLPATATATQTHTPTPTVTNTPAPTPTPLPVGAGYGNPSVESGIACFGHYSFGLTCLDEDGWHHYTPSNSALYGKSVYKVELCPDGGFAIAHDNGIVFFDGQAFLNPLSSYWGIESIRAFDCDAENTLAVAHPGSLRLYQQNAWIEIDISELAPQEDPPERVVISDLVFDQSGALWVVGDLNYVDGSIAKYEDQSWTRFPDILDLGDDINLHNLEVDSQGKIWAIHNTGLFSYDGQNWIHYPAPGTEPLRDSFIDSDDRIWITTTFGFVSFYDGGWNIYTVDNDGQSDDQPTGIAFDGRGRLWLPTGWGLTIFDGEQWTTYHMHTSGIAANSATSMAIQAGGPSLPALLEKETGSISGRFFLNGQPLQNVDVEVCVKSLGMFYTGSTPCAKHPYFVRGKTDEQGQYSFTVPPGHYYLAFKAEDEETWTRLTSGFAGITSMRIDVMPGEDTKLDDIYLTE